VEGVVINPGSWQGRRVFVTGHTGFKGSWLTQWLRELGAEIHGYSLDPPTDPNLFTVASIGMAVASDTRSDIRDSTALQAALRRAKPDVVFHLAAQSLVRMSYRTPVETFDVNVIGTANILQAIRDVPSVRAVVVVTSDKCYQNRGSGQPYRETDAMGGDDPYSASKACAEIVVSSFRSSAGTADTGIAAAAIASARSGNVIGGGDWSPERLVPDCIRAFARGESVKLRYPDAVRPWLHVLEPLAGYLTLAEGLLGGDTELYAAAFNFGPGKGGDANVGRVAKIVAQLWGEGASVETAPGAHSPEAALLRLDATKARTVLGWQARWDLSKTLERTVEWYRAWHAGKDVRSLLTRQLADFTSAAYI
jgi:CDP-glucose 4,6-dehydratase